ncbi:MAG: right-handed parallel beta-helix repeat-containing protein [Pirellulales bacterium]
MHVSRILLLGLLAGLLVSGAAEVSARDIFVSNTTGDDTQNGRQPTGSDIGGPVQTLARALAVAGPGDHIHIANTGVPYRESISLSGGDHSGFVALPFVIEGNGAVLDGTAPIPDDAWTVVRGDLYKFRPAGGGNLRLFQPDGKPLPEVKLASDAKQLPPLAAGQWCEHDGYAYFLCAFGKLPRDYSLAYAKLPVGITLEEVHDVRIVDLVVQGYQRDGVNVHDGVLKASLGGLTLRGNGRCGLYVGGSSQAIVEGGLIGDNGQAQVIIDGPSTAGFKGCNILDQTAPAIVRPKRGERVYVDGKLQE